MHLLIQSKIIFQNTVYKDQKGMHLENLLLKGIEKFSLANDVCGKPIDEKNFFIWKYFNGISYFNGVLRIATS